MAPFDTLSLHRLRELIQTSTPRSITVSGEKTSNRETNGLPPPYSSLGNASVQTKTDLRGIPSPQKKDDVAVETYATDDVATAGKVKNLQPPSSQPKSDTTVQPTAKKAIAKPPYMIEGLYRPYIDREHFATLLVIYYQAHVQAPISCDDVHIHDNALVSGDVVSLGRAVIYGHARVTGNLTVSGKTTINEAALVSGDIIAAEDAEIRGRAHISGKLCVARDLTVFGNAVVTGDVYVERNASISENAVITGALRVSGKCRVKGNAQVSDSTAARPTSARLDPSFAPFDGVLSIVQDNGPKWVAVRGDRDAAEDENSIDSALIEREDLSSLLQDTLGESRSFSREDLNSQKHITNQSIVLQWRDRTAKKMHKTRFFVSETCAFDIVLGKKFMDENQIQL